MFMLSFLTWTIALIGWAALIGAFFAGVASSLKRWSTARLLARSATLASAGALAVFVATFGVGVASAALFLPRNADTTQRARYLAQGISELMNCAAVSVPALLVAGPLWFFAARRARRGGARER